MNRSASTEYQESSSKYQQVKAGFFENLSHSIQILMMTHSWYNIFAYFLKPVNYFLTYYRKFLNEVVSFLKKESSLSKSHFSQIQKPFPMSIQQRASERIKLITSTTSASSMEKTLSAQVESGWPASTISRKT